MRRDQESSRDSAARCDRGAGVSLDRRYGMVDLGTLGGTYREASDVNERDEVAGVADFANERRRAVVWDARNQTRRALPERRTERQRRNRRE